jgi:hypothetical protein
MLEASAYDYVNHLGLALFLSCRVSRQSSDTERVRDSLHIIDIRDKVFVAYGILAEACELVLFQNIGVRDDVRPLCSAIRANKIFQLALLVWSTTRDLADVSCITRLQSPDVRNSVGEILCVVRVIAVDFEAVFGLAEHCDRTVTIRDRRMFLEILFTTAHSTE